MIHKLLKFEEGYREEPYYCSEGFPTIGYGQRIGPKGIDLKLYQFTCSEELAKVWLDESLAPIFLELTYQPWFIALNLDRQSVIVSMAYQLGISGLYKFKRMVAALVKEDWETACTEALDSKWARQTIGRANRHATILLHGDFAKVYPNLG